MAALLAWLCAACAGEQAETSEQDEDDARIVPASLDVTALAGGNGVLELVALTLLEREGHAEVYAALRNAGDVSACSAALSIELFDAAGQSLAAGIDGLLTQRFYRLTDGSGSLAACIGPGELSMAAITDLGAELAVDDVASLVYRAPYSALDVEPVDGLRIDGVERELRAEGTAYTGMLVNGFEVAVSRPSVRVFATTRVGRPLGMVSASSSEELAPGGRWAFETGAVDASATDHAAYPAAALSASARR